MNAEQKLKKLQSKVNRVIDEISFSEFFDKIPDVIIARTRNGESLNGGSLPNLKASTIERRERLDRNGELSSETAPFFSNLTESGNLLDSLRMKKKGSSYILGFDERRSKNGVRPSQLKDYLEDKGFVFFGLQDKERDKLEANCGKKIEKEIAKIFR